MPTSFYLEGGRGEHYWSGGWRLGVIRQLPIKGSKKGFAEVELTVPLYGWSDGKGHARNGSPLPNAFLKRPRGYFKKAPERAWVSIYNLNPVGDTTYHGPHLAELVAERKEEKAADIKKAAKRVAV